MVSMTEQHSHTVLVAEGAGSLEAAMLSSIDVFFVHMTKQQSSLVSRLFRIACGIASFSITQQYAGVRDGKNNSPLAAYFQGCAESWLPLKHASIGMICVLWWQQDIWLMVRL